MLDRIKGGLFGVAVGDALGATTEFMSAEEVRERYGKVTDIMGGGYFDLLPGEVTDDTAMTIAVAKGIIRNKENPIAEIGEEFLKWYKTNPPDVGIIIRTVLRRYQGDWFAAAVQACEELGGRCAGICGPREDGRNNDFAFPHDACGRTGDRGVPDLQPRRLSGASRRAARQGDSERSGAYPL